MTRSFGAAILGCAGLRLTPAEKRFFAQCWPAGFILFQRNLDTAEQIRALCADLRDAVGWGAPIFIDQEGGRVQRMWAPLVTDFLPPLDDVARLGSKAARGMALRYGIIAAELHRLGIDGNCSPALDVARDETHPFLRNRLLSDDPEVVSRLGRVIVDAQLEQGVLPVIKHMPGHGLGTADSHLHLPRSAASAEVLDAIDFAPFKALSDVPLGMSAHLVFEAFDGEEPATVSGTMISVIRDRIGFGGVLMTDDISMEALSGTVADRGAAARAAGCDLVLHCNGDMCEMQSLMDRIGRLDAGDHARVMSAYGQRICPETVDIAAMRAEFEAL
ncbi:glycoside hydrolase family 3 N-terminal domain-containing protein [Cognatishimia sp. F0-27]|uniref:glycoside hydrolase family 3 N-terminal domain-containing protein n=1 Tax=Cognatishimia sp. F0-27 TaxID=2816855 RepID=UPI001D0C462F|nr:glycoside hydrolase family 3 protein [Cognatishimia sp. F0-27]